MGNLTGWHGLILVLVVLLLFAAPKLPGLARSLGQSITIFRGEVKKPAVEETASANDEAAKPGA
jgi:sec-independent protein translocase protein TatA